MTNSKIVELLVKIRTSFTYVALAITLPLGWITFHRLGLIHIDNEDMTYLNLTLSILAEVQGVVLLIYSSQIAKKQAQIAEKIEELEEAGD